MNRAEHTVLLVLLALAILVLTWLLAPWPRLVLLLTLVPLVLAFGGSVQRSVVPARRSLLMTQRFSARGIRSFAAGARSGSEPPPDEIGDYIRSLPVGRIAIKVAERMRVHAPSPLSVAIGTGEQHEILAAIAETAGAAMVDPVKVGRLMRVEVGGPGFVVENDPNLDKVVVDEPVAWNFTVTPERRGRLTLSVRAIVRLQLADAPRQEFYECPVHRRDVRVTVNYGYSLQQLARLLFNKFVALVVALWGVVVYLASLESVKKYISDFIAPALKPLFDALGHLVGAL